MMVEGARYPLLLKQSLSNLLQEHTKHIYLHLRQEQSCSGCDTLGNLGENSPRSFAAMIN